MNNEKSYVEKLAEELNVNEEELIYDIWDKVNSLVPGFYMSENNFYQTLDNMISFLLEHSKSSTIGEKISAVYIKERIIHTIKVISDVFGPKLSEPITVCF